MSANPARFTTRDLFVGGQEGYPSYRIPALAVSRTGALLAFCEGRRHTAAERGPIDIVLKRSFDGGATWRPMQIVASEPDTKCGSPCPVVDRNAGTILLLFCRNPADGHEGLVLEGKATRTVWITRSADNGGTWSPPEEITRTVKHPNWTWYITGPGHGIELKSGRLLVPGNHVVGVNRNRRDPQRSHVIYSDDHGSTWALGGIVGNGTRQATILQTAQGAIYMNCRTGQSLCSRMTSWSYDSGKTFPLTQIDNVLTDTKEGLGCHASLVRLTSADTQGKNRVLFTNPGCREKRRKLTVRASYDECKTWKDLKTICESQSAYSDLAILPDMTINCLHENGTASPSEKISLAQFNLEWLTDGADSVG